MNVFAFCLAAMAAIASGASIVTGHGKPNAPALLSSQGPIATILPASSESAVHQASSFDKGAHQATSSAGQGSFGYDHGAQASKKFGNKESSGSRESYAFSSHNAYDQGAGSFSHSGGFNNAANLASGLGKHFQQTGSLSAIGSTLPGFPGVTVPALPSGISHQHNLATAGLGNHFQGTGLAGISPIAKDSTAVLPGVVPGFLGGVYGTPLGTLSSTVGGHQLGSLATGYGQGQGSWSYNRGHSSVNSSGHKETFSNKESFGQESSAGHAVGAGHSAQSQSSQTGHHDKGHQTSTVNNSVIG